MPPPVQRLVLWRTVLDAAHLALRDAARDIDPFDVAAVDRLRRDWPAEEVTIALELARARRRAAAKFPRPEALVADVPGVEQATSALTAAFKAERFAAIAPRRIVDLCCGIGGDAMSFASIAETLAVDLDPVRAWMAQTNAGCASTVADVATLDLRGEVVHLDPQRRDGAGRRRWRYDDYRPGPSVIENLLSRNPDGAVKLGPGIDPDEVPIGDERELHWISEHGRLVQAVLWTGRLAQNAGRRTATTLPARCSISGVPAPPPRGDGVSFASVLCVPDPALERSSLVGQVAADLGLVAPWPALGLLTGDAAHDSPWVTAFEVVAQMPWRLGPVRRWLRDHGAGDVEIKTRGRAVDPDPVARELRGAGDERFTVFVLRVDRKKVAVVTRRLGRG